MVLVSNISSYKYKIDKAYAHKEFAYKRNYSVELIV